MVRFEHALLSAEDISTFPKTTKPQRQYRAIVVIAVGVPPVQVKVGV
jgi:hypothetical protein